MVPSKPPGQPVPPSGWQAIFSLLAPAAALPWFKTVIFRTEAVPIGSPALGGDDQDGVFTTRSVVALTDIAAEGLAGFRIGLSVPPAA